MGYIHGYNNGQGEWTHLTVNEDRPLLEWLLDNLKESRTKVKATLQGRGIKVNGKCVTQFDFPLKQGMKVAVSKTKRNQQAFKSRYVKIVYEDRWIVVVEKNIGILSMAALLCPHPVPTHQRMQTRSCQSQSSCPHRIWHQRHYLSSR